MGNGFVTADLVHVDDAGYIHHHGRVDDVRNASGYRVSPAEVENCIVRHPAVSEVAVTEEVLRDGVSVIAAFVVAAETDCQPTKIISFAARHLAA